MREYDLQSDFELKVIRRAVHLHASEGSLSLQSVPVRKAANCKPSLLMEERRGQKSHTTSEAFPNTSNLLHFTLQIIATL